MSGRCRYHHSLFGRGKASAYVFGPDGRRIRVTRDQILRGRLPAGATEVLFAPTGHISDDRLARAPEVLRLPAEAASALLRGRGRTLPPPARVEGASKVTQHRESETYDLPVDLTYSVHRVGGRSLVFGGFPDHDYGPDVEVVPRNPYFISRTVPGTPEGDDLALAYVHAQVALVEAAWPGCYGCGEGGGRGSCSAPETDVWDLHARQDAVERFQHLLPPRDGFDAGVGTTFVDALLLAASEGDISAEAHLRALAAAGERLVAAADPLLPRYPLADHGPRFLTPYVEASNEPDPVERERLQRLVLDGARAELSRLDSEWRRRLGYGNAQEPAERAAHVAAANAMYDEKNHLERTIAAMEAGTAAGDGTGLCFVHETAFEPEVDAQGNVLLRPRGDHEPDGYRDTIHGTLNHRASGHIFRTGGGARMAVIVDMRRLMEANPGALTNAHAVDVRLVPPPREPLVIPADAVTIVRYEDGMGPEGRTEMVEQELSRRGMEVFAGGSHGSCADGEASALVLAASMGVGEFAHAGAPDGGVEDALWTESLGVARAGPPLTAQAARVLGRNALLRLFDRGGDAPYGRPATRSWTGASAWSRF